MLFKSIELGYLLFTIFFGLLALWSLFHIVLNVYQLLTWTKTEATIVELTTKRIGRRRTNIFVVEYNGTDGEVHKQPIKVDGTYSAKFLNSYNNKDKVSIAYNIKKGEAIFTQSMESFIGLSTIAALCIVVVVYLLPMIQK